MEAYIKITTSNGQEAAIACQHVIWTTIDNMDPRLLWIDTVSNAGKEGGYSFVFDTPEQALEAYNRVVNSL